MAGAFDETAVVKLVYVLNHYSKDESSHFVHVLPLLDELARRGVKILLVIEKAADLPAIAHANVEVIGIRENVPTRRLVRLSGIIRAAVKSGYRTVFVRIAVPAALAAVAGCLGSDARVFYWQSGTVHAIDRASHGGFRKLAWLVRHWLPLRLVIHCVDRFATGPERMIQYYREEVGVPARKLIKLYNDIDVDGFRARIAMGDRSAERARLGADETTPVILFVHRLSPVRRTMDFVPALLQALRDRFGRSWIMVFAGGGPELDSLVAGISHAGVDQQCRVLGDVPGHELPALYRTADLFVHPTYAEGFPRVILEALAAGLPLVTTDAGGTSELLGPLQQQFVISREDPAGFAAAVARLLENPQLQRELAAENEVTVRRFDTPVIAAMYQRELFG